VQFAGSSGVPKGGVFKSPSKASIAANNVVPMIQPIPFECGLCHEGDSMFDDDDLDDDAMPAWADADAEVAALQEAEDRHAVRLCDNGREDAPVNGGMPAWWYKAEYLDEP
jgi:hypothetical protein